MAKNKSSKKKKKLGKAIAKNRTIPAFVTLKTNRRVSRNPRRRNWRSKKLKIKEK